MFGFDWDADGESGLFDDVITFALLDELECNERYDGQEDEDDESEELQ